MYDKKPGHSVAATHVLGEDVTVGSTPTGPKILYDASTHPRGRNVNVFTFR
ncbi:MAG: hypothetical protein UY60_C0005G0044 [Parcubacteria group bacterium GW2011_GWB1_50_9]|nr:MAG: hypothetical protein UY60_C0005G0044 [Parcubacteria group bacterium GW2011_GWB1_50_9]